MTTSPHSHSLYFPCCTDPPPPLQMPCSWISSLLEIYFPITSPLPQAFSFAVLWGKYQPASFPLPSSQQPRPIALEGFGLSGVPKFSDFPMWEGHPPVRVGPSARSWLLTTWRLGSANEGSRPRWQACCLVSHYCSQWQINKKKKGGERPC